MQTKVSWNRLRIILFVIKKNSTCAFGQYCRILVVGDGCHLYSSEIWEFIRKYPNVASLTHTHAPDVLLIIYFSGRFRSTTHETLMHSMSRSLWTSRLATQGSATRQTLCPITLHITLPAAWSTPKQHNTFSPFALQFKIPSLSALHRFPSTAHLHIIL